MAASIEPMECSQVHFMTQSRHNFEQTSFYSILVPGVILGLGYGLYHVDFQAFLDFIAANTHHDPVVVREVIEEKKND